jgi:hypothetical protein
MVASAIGLRTSDGITGMEGVCWHAIVWVLVASLGNLGFVSSQGPIPAKALQETDTLMVSASAWLAADESLGGVRLDLSPLLAYQYQHRQPLETSVGQVALPCRGLPIPNSGAGGGWARDGALRANRFNSNALVLCFFPRR